MEAIDDAIENESCAVGLTDVVVTNEYLGYTMFNVEGNLVTDQNKLGCENFKKKTYIINDES